MLMRNPETSAISTERLARWWRLTNGLADRSSRGTQTTSTRALATMIMKVAGDAHPQEPPSLRTTETPVTARLSSTAPDASKARGAAVVFEGRTSTEETRAPATTMAPNQ